VEFILSVAEGPQNDTRTQSHTGNEKSQALANRKICASRETFTRLEEDKKLFFTPERQVSRQNFYSYLPGL
jgi:hypothetical protein